MAFDSYSSLQTSVLNWIGRPGDPAVAPFVPDFITLFEREANRRLRVIDAERDARLAMPANGELVLPNDCWAVRTVFWEGRELEYRPPGDAAFIGTGIPMFYTLLGFNQGSDPPPETRGRFVAFFLLVGPGAAGPGTVEIIYQVGVPPLSEARPLNWLLESHGDAYLYGTLVEAEAFIGNDERAPMWLARRDAAFASIEAYDRKTRWAGPLTIRPDLWDLGGGGAVAGGASAPVPMPVGVVRVVSPISGATVTMNAADSAMLVTSGPLAALTILLPPTSVEREVEISFAAPVTALVVQDSEGTVVADGPTSAYGPGAGLVFRWVTGIGFQYWK